MHPTIPTPSSTKRQQFRSQIRNRQVTKLLSQHRKKFQYYQSSQQQHNNYLLANNQLMAKSLQPNQLLPQLPQLLPAINYKIINNPSIQNIQFVVALCSNLLQDKVTIDQKQSIYMICMQTIGINKLITISSIIQVNLYNVIISTCYSSLDQAKQIQIQKLIIPRLMQLLKLQAINISRTSSNYTNQQCIEQVYQGCLSSFLNYYQPQRDHNMILMYKTKRTINVIQFIINWWIQQKTSIQRCKNYIEILQIFNAIFGNITQIPLQFYTFIHNQNIFWNLINIFIQQIWIYNQKFTYAKTIALRVLINLLGIQTQFIQNCIKSDTINILIRQLQNSIANDYTIQLLILLNNIVAGFKSQNTIIDNHISNLLSVIKDILQKQSYQIQKSIITKCLLLIRSILMRGFETGNSQYRNMLSSIGVINLLDDLYVTTKDVEMFEIIDSISYFVDLC